MLLGWQLGRGCLVLHVSPSPALRTSWPVTTGNLVTSHHVHAVATLHGEVRRLGARPNDHIQHFVQGPTTSTSSSPQRRDRGGAPQPAATDRRDLEELALTDDLGPGPLCLPEEYANFVGRHRSSKEKPLSDVALVDLELGQLRRLFDTFSERLEI